MDETALRNDIHRALADLHDRMIDAYSSDTYLHSEETKRAAWEALRSAECRILEAIMGRTRTRTLMDAMLYIARMEQRRDRRSWPWWRRIAALMAGL